MRLNGFSWTLQYGRKVTFYLEEDKMFHSEFRINLPVCALTAMLGVAAADAIAHTTIKDQMVEGKTGYNALQIGHGCEDPVRTNSRGEPYIYPVTAQSVVFPTLNPIVTRSDGAVTSLDAEVETDTLAGHFDLVQDRNVFTVQNEKYDANGNTIGFYGRKGYLQTNLRGLVPFRVNAINFLPTSCAARLLIKVAIADICRSKFPPKAGTANLWIPENTPAFSDPEIDGIGGAATLIINRDLVANPLDAQSCGAGYDVTVTHSPEDIDTNLPIRGHWWTKPVKQ